MKQNRCGRIDLGLKSWTKKRFAPSPSCTTSAHAWCNDLVFCLIFCTSRIIYSAGTSVQKTPSTYDDISRNINLAQANPQFWNMNPSWSLEGEWCCCCGGSCYNVRFVSYTWRGTDWFAQFLCIGSSYINQTKSANIYHSKCEVFGFQVHTVQCIRYN